MARADAQRARATVSGALQDADIATRAAAELVVASNHLQAERNLATARATAAERRATAAEVQFDSLAAEAAAECADCPFLAPVINAAERALTVKDTAIAQLTAALHIADAQVITLTRGIDTLTTTVTRLRAASQTLVRADAALAKQAKGPWYLRYLPRPGAGVAAGFDPAGTPRVVTGITLGWTF